MRDMKKFGLDLDQRTLTQVTRLCWPRGMVWSTGFLPVRSSKSTTPKLYTSLFWVNCPVIAYLHIGQINMLAAYQTFILTQTIMVQETLLWSMITKSSQDSCRVKTSSIIRRLIWEIEISNLCFEVFEKKNIARPYVSMDYRRLWLLMKVFQTPSCFNRYFHPRYPVKCWTWLCPLNSLPTCNRTIRNQLHGHILFVTDTFGQTRKLILPCKMSCKDPIVANSYARTRRFPSTQKPSNWMRFSCFSLETMETYGRAKY